MKGKPISGSGKIRFRKSGIETESAIYREGVCRIKCISGIAGIITMKKRVSIIVLPGMIETGIDAMQTYFYYSPEAQGRICGNHPTTSEGTSSGRRYEDKSRFYMNKLCVST